MFVALWDSGRLHGAGSGEGRHNRALVLAAGRVGGDHGAYARY